MLPEIVCAYIVGCLMPAYYLYHSVTNQDIRDCGSGNPGASNIWALLGPKYGLITLAIDAGKTIAAMIVGLSLGLAYPQALGLGICGVLGHCFPAQLGFRGGKGIASTAGIVVASAWFLSPWSSVILIAVGLFVFWTVYHWKKLVSLASLAMIGSLLLLTMASSVVWSVKVEVLFLAIVLILRHTANIKRLLRGEELPLETLQLRA